MATKEWTENDIWWKWSIDLTHQRASFLPAAEFHLLDEHLESHHRGNSCHPFPAVLSIHLQYHVTHTYPCRLPLTTCGSAWEERGETDS